MFKQSPEKVFAAIEARDFDALQKALRRPVDLTRKNKQGQTALHVWVDTGWRADDRFLDALLRAGADINQPDVEGRTPLDRAMRAPHSVWYGSEQLYAPFHEKVVALYERNAKPAKMEILRIRQVLLGARGRPSDYSDSPEPPYFVETMTRLQAVLDKCGHGKTIPPVDAPVYADNRDDPYIAFARSVHYVHTLASALDSRIHSDCFYSLLGNIAESSWEEFSQTIPADPHEACRPVNALMRETVRNIVYPALMRGLDEPTRQKLDGQDAVNIANWEMYPSLANAIAEGRQPHQVLALARSYQQQETRLLDTLQSHIDHLEWGPLLATKDATLKAPHSGDDLHVVNLTNVEALREESARLQQPITGFTSRCMEGDAHVFSIRDGTERSVSAFALAPYYDPKAGETRYRLLEHLPAKGTTLSAKANRFADWLIAHQFSRSVPFGEYHQMGGLYDAEHIRPGLEKHSYHLMLDMTPRRHQQLFDLLCGRAMHSLVIADDEGGRLFSEPLRQLDVEDFLEQSGVNTDILKAGSHFALKSYTPPQKPANRLNWEERMQQDAKRRILGR